MCGTIGRGQSLCDLLARLTSIRALQPMCRLVCIRSKRCFHHTVCHCLLRLPFGLQSLETGKPLSKVINLQHDSRHRQDGAAVDSHTDATTARTAASRSGKGRSSSGQAGPHRSKAAVSRQTRQGAAAPQQATATSKPSRRAAASFMQRWPRRRSVLSFLPTCCGSGHRDP